MMMARIASLACLLVALLAGPARAANFDYYLLSLSWSPEYCSETRRNDEPQCARPYAFVAHGLWPQYERGGYPRDCPARGRVSEATIERMLPIMPSRPLVIHEWRSHGACTGLPADDYFARIEKAYTSVHIPARYSKLTEAVTIDPIELKHELIRNNPGIPQSGVVMQCSGKYLQEVRICLDRELQPRACAPDVRDHCGRSATLRPVR
jgi:ribonuclease T2